MQSNEAPRCQHIKTNGTQCGSLALKDNQFCYYHQQCRTVTFNYRGSYRDYSASEVHLPAFEDVHSIQFTLRQVTELILRHKIDLKEAGLILYALQIASSNLKRLELEEPEPEDVLTDAQIEHPVETPEEAQAFQELQADEIDRIYGCASETDDRVPPALAGFETWDSTVVSSLSVFTTRCRPSLTPSPPLPRIPIEAARIVF